MILQTAIDFAGLPLRPEVFTIPGFSAFGTEIGPLSLRWYALSYIVGVIAAWWLFVRMARQPGAPLTEPQIDDYISWGTLGVILGGRLGYVLFYNPAKFAADPIAILRLWDGGMAFHGGAAGVIVAGFAYGAAHRVSGLRILDYIAVVAPVGLLLGRLANFINGELWGRPTGSDWGVIFPDAGPEPRYPSQLFEAGLEGVVLFAVLNWLFWRTGARARPGLLAGVFGIGYGAARFVVEFFREPDRQLGVLSTGLTMGQSLSLPFIIAGLLLVIRALRRPVVVA